jgi:hypothetical protein
MCSRRAITRKQYHARTASASELLAAETGGLAMAEVMRFLSAYDWFKTDDSGASPFGFLD